MNLIAVAKSQGIASVSKLSSTEVVALSPGPTQLSMLHAEKWGEPGMRRHVKNVTMMYYDVIKKSQKIGLRKRAILS